jgi:hypothetical protein
MRSSYITVAAIRRQSFLHSRRSFRPILWSPSTCFASRKALSKTLQRLHSSWPEASSGSRNKDVPPTTRCRRSTGLGESRSSSQSIPVLTRPRNCDSIVEIASGAEGEETEMDRENARCIWLFKVSLCDKRHPHMLSATLSFRTKAFAHS